MSERPLPDDPAEWPTNPYELLDVSRDVTPRDLRRAYNRLIRIYKPEQSPDQFRRIREAYESVLRIAELFGSFTPALEPVPEELPMPSVQEPAHPEEMARAEVEQPVRKSLPDEMDELWDLALNGQPAAAYERLRQLVHQHPGRVEVYLRLYWLLTLAPDLDTRREPVDWLVAGLSDTRLAGALWELYREELADNPVEALGERFDSLLAAPFSTGFLADLAELRFDAGMAQGRWEMLANDTRQLRLRFGPGEDRLWLRLLFKLIEGLAWQEDPAARDLLEACRLDIARHEYLATELSAGFDRVDLVLEAAGRWRVLRRGRLPDELLRLLAACWSRPFREARPLLATVLKASATEASRWLEYFDEVHKQAPLTLSIFGDLLDQWENTQAHSPVRVGDPDQVKRLLLPLLSRLNFARYAAQRTEVLLLCLREVLAPEEIAEAATGLPPAWSAAGVVWAKVLLDDWPLRYVCRAYRLFWA